MTDAWVGQPVQLRQRHPQIERAPDRGHPEHLAGVFRTLAIALKRGRKFTAHDNTTSVPVAIVNENLVRLFWPQYPEGQILSGSTSLLVTILSR